MRFKLPADMGTAKFKDGVPVLSPEPYVAYLAGETRHIRLRICPPMQYWRRFPYAHLTQIGENGLAESELLLGFPTAVILIRGRNMTAIADAVSEERCEVVQAFDPRRWKRPTDAAAPFIESINILDALPEGSPASNQQLQVSTDKKTAN